MRTIHVIVAWLYGPQGILPGGDAFEKKYARFRPGRTTRYEFPTESLCREALNDLRRYGLENEHLYRFVLDEDEVASYPAFYFGTTVEDDFLTGGIVDTGRTAGAEIVRDYDSERIICSPRARQIIERETIGVEWSVVPATEGDEWGVIDRVVELPDPIIVPAPMEVNRNVTPPGTYAVRSDGRDVITAANAATLAKVGLATGAEVRAGTRVRRWRPRYVASGRLIDALLKAGISGVLEPLVPLLTESNPLASER